MNKKILIVDDNKLIQFGLEKALEKTGFVVSVTSGTASALKRLAAENYDLCLIDVHLSDSNGLKLFNVIRTAFPQTRVIMMAASGTGFRDANSDVRSSMESDACHFIIKPFNLCDFREIVEIVMLIEMGRATTDFSIEEEHDRNKSEGITPKAFS